MPNSWPRRKILADQIREAMDRKGVTLLGARLVDGHEPDRRLSAPRPEGHWGERFPAPPPCSQLPLVGERLPPPRS